MWKISEKSREILVSLAAIVIAVGNPAATSTAKEGPERIAIEQLSISSSTTSVSYTHLRAHET